MDMKSGSITSQQMKKLYAEMERLGVGKEQMEERIGGPISQLSVFQASELIDSLVRQEKDQKEQKGTAVPENSIPKSREEALARKAEKEAKPVFQVSPGSTLAMARSLGIPEEMANLFFMNLNGNAYIKVAGLQYIAGKIGYRRIEIWDHYDPEQKTWIAEARIYPKIDSKTLEALAKLSPDAQKMAYEDMSKPTNGLGTANKENVQNTKMHSFLREMAQTRALGRALRSYTGYGGTTYEELPDAEWKEE